MIIQLDVYVLVYLLIYCSALTIVLFLARRDVKFGLKKWFMNKRGLQPMILRYHDASLNVSEHIVATKGVGDTVSLFDSKWFGLKKTKTGSTFFLDEKFIRRRDDGVNELSYSYKSVSPAFHDPGVVNKENSKIKLNIESSLSDENVSSSPVSIDDNVLYTDPRRINRFIELIKTSAKAEALEAAGADVLKWTKFAFYAAAAAAVMGVLIWYTMDSQLFPLIENLGRQVSEVGRGLIEV